MEGKAGIESFTGYTRRYAEWIAEEMDLQVCNLKEVHDSGRSDSYLLIGVPVHGQELCSIRKIRNQIKNKDPWKKVVVFATGLRRADEHVREKILQYNFKGERPDAPLKPFYLCLFYYCSVL